MTALILRTAKKVKRYSVRRLLLPPLLLLFLTLLLFLGVLFGGSPEAQGSRDTTGPRAAHERSY